MEIFAQGDTGEEEKQEEGGICLYIKYNSLSNIHDVPEQARLHHLRQCPEQEASLPPDSPVLAFSWLLFAIFSVHMIIRQQSFEVMIVVTLITPAPSNFPTHHLVAEIILSFLNILTPGKRYLKMSLLPRHMLVKEPELPHADFCSVRKPVLSTDAIQTPKRQTGTDGLLTKKLLAGATHQAALPPLPKYGTVYISPLRRALHLQKQRFLHRTGSVFKLADGSTETAQKACCSRALNRTRLIEIHFWFWHLPANVLLQQSLGIGVFIHAMVICKNWWLEDSEWLDKCHLPFILDQSCEHLEFRKKVSKQLCGKLRGLITPLQQQLLARVIRFVSICKIKYTRKCSREVATATCGAIILAKLSIIPVLRGYWGNKIGKPNAVHCKMTGSLWLWAGEYHPCPRGTGIISAPVLKKLLLMASIDDCYTSVRGCTATLGNFAKATFDAISKTYSYLTPDLWKQMLFTKSPYQEFTDHLIKTHTRVLNKSFSEKNQKQVILQDYIGTKFKMHVEHRNETEQLALWSAEPMRRDGCDPSTLQVFPESQTLRATLEIPHFPKLPAKNGPQPASCDTFKSPRAKQAPFGKEGKASLGSLLLGLQRPACSCFTEFVESKTVQGPGAMQMKQHGTERVSFQNRQSRSQLGTRSSWWGKDVKERRASEKFSLATEMPFSTVSIL
eukprot:bmy_03839T0